MLKILEKIHAGSETNCEEGSGSGSEKIHSGSTTLIFMNFQWKTLTFASGIKTAENYTGFMRKKIFPIKPYCQIILHLKIILKNFCTSV
jgi:hypothetical protein